MSETRNKAPRWLPGVLVEARRLRQSRLEPATVARWCARLARLPKARLRRWVAATARYSRVEICYGFIDWSHALRHRDPKAMLEHARRAVRVAAALPASVAPQTVLADARTNAWLCLANALRVNNRLPRAERALRMARFWLEQGSGDAFLGAKWAWYAGTLRASQRRYREALERFHEAQRVYEEAEDDHLAAEVLVAIGRTHWLIGDVNQAGRCLRLALRGIDPRRDRYLTVGTIQLLVNTLNDAGFTADAAAALRCLYPLHDLDPGDVLLLRCQWLEAKLWAKLGQVEPAMRLLDSIRNAFLDLDLPFDAAQAALDLAALHAEAGQHARVAELAGEMFPVFNALEIQPEARLSLLLFVRSAQADRVSAEDIADLSRRLDEARKFPG